MPHSSDVTNQVSCRNALNFAPQDRAALMNRGPSVMGLKVGDHSLQFAVS